MNNSIQQNQYALKGVNRDVIKYIAVFAMVCNHVAQMFMKEETILAAVLTGIGIFTAPTMCYFLVEGFRYTKNRVNYRNRLFVWALISQFPYMLALSGGMNMLFTLLVCFEILNVLELYPEGTRKTVMLCLLIALTSICDWGIMAPVFTILLAKSQGDRSKIRRAYCVLAGLYLVLVPLARLIVEGASGSVAAILTESVIAMTTIFLSYFTVTHWYNGQKMKRGRTFHKWFFYIFYPAHLILLLWIRAMV